MKLIENIQQLIGNYFFRNEYNLHKRDIIVNNIDAVSSVGVIFSADTEENYRIISKFAILLKKEGVKNIHLLGYTKEKELPSYLGAKLGQDFLLKKELNWYLKPDSTAAKNFIHEPFDILIDLTIENIFPLLYILGKSSAHFKVGKGNCGKDFLFDMMINTNAEGLENLSKQILHYLRQINKVDGDVIAMLK